ncbi:MAG: hypothetical protein HQK51_10570, partial [Oligoflexia bacterium]|nr:hypothetical protein [Oligoflexia bacterium]
KTRKVNEKLDLDKPEYNGIIQVNVECKEEASVKYVVIEISDNGVGIAKNIMDKIYDPFYTTKPTGQKTGLGLSISKGIVEQFRGSIECFSDPNIQKDGDIVTTFKIKFITIN